jgi:AmmeMemoRadiSam system protein B/AmmeMemoRadiSam system protein A
MRFGWKTPWPIVVLIGLLAANPAVFWAQTIRPPVWAGRFYPADADVLTRQIEALMDQAAASPPPRLPEGRLRAVVMPHAGYQFSGLTAAHALRLMAGETFEKVVLLGPDHRVGLRNGAVSAAEAWQTPLGLVPVHPDARRLVRSDLFRAVPASDRQEHSIEVLLPLLQCALKDIRIVPVVLGPGDLAGMIREIDAIVDADTLLVVSSDLSHGLPEAQARSYDRQTLETILALDAAALLQRENGACGRIPLAVLISIARERGWRPALVNYRNSGDVPQGSDDWIVGYAAVAFYGEDLMKDNPSAPASGLTESQGRLLIRLARQTIGQRLGQRPVSADVSAEAAVEQALQRRSGTFVTLKIDNRLRGCIGSLIPSESIVEGVRRNALNAAFNDYRFSPLTAEELERVVIEVSILTPPAALAYRDADDLVGRLRPGVDGVILRKGGHSATFLPQVWEQLPRTEDFLGHLCLKAGLEADAWRRGDLAVETYQVVYFEEPH